VLGFCDLVRREMKREGNGKDGIIFPCLVTSEIGRRNCSCYPPLLVLEHLLVLFFNKLNKS